MEAECLYGTVNFSYPSPNVTCFVFCPATLPSYQLNPHPNPWFPFPLTYTHTAAKRPTLASVAVRSFVTNSNFEESIMKGRQGRNQRQKVKQRPWRNSPYWLAWFTFLHTPRVTALGMVDWALLHWSSIKKTPCRLCQWDNLMGTFSQLQTTPYCVKLKTKQNLASMPSKSGIAFSEFGSTLSPAPWLSHCGYYNVLLRFYPLVSPL